MPRVNYWGCSWLYDWHQKPKVILISVHFCTCKSIRVYIFFRKRWGEWISRVFELLEILWYILTGCFMISRMKIVLIVYTMAKFIDVPLLCRSSITKPSRDLRIQVKWMLYSLPLKFVIVITLIIPTKLNNCNSGVQILWNTIIIDFSRKRRGVRIISGFVQNLEQ